MARICKFKGAKQEFLLEREQKAEKNKKSKSHNDVDQ